jgi:glycosyltransferase involved in cell wall biosynthesis
MIVAYVMSRFPRLTETFVVTEIQAMKELGVDVRIYPLLRERAAMVQPDAEPLVADAQYQPFLSPAIAWSNVRYLVRRPMTYLRTLGALVRMTWGSPKFLFGGLAVFPKVVHNADAMRRAGVSHVHCHFANHPATAGFLIRRLAGIPFSFTAHGSDLHKDRTGLRTKVAEASFVVAISEYNRRVVLEECGDRWASRVVVIHCGVRTDRFQPAERGPRHAGSLSVLCVGTLHEVKGQSYLVEACRLLVEVGVPVRCTLIGDGEDRQRLRAQIAEAGLADVVDLAGPATQSEVRERLADADVLVAPSVPTAEGRREGIPVVLMEAMSSGVAVIASDLSGIPELVVDGVTGLLTPPGDAAAIAGALRRLAGGPALRSELARRGRERVLGEFDARTNARILASHFTPRAA